MRDDAPPTCTPSTQLTEPAEHVNAIKRLLLGTPFGRSARRMYHWLGGRRATHALTEWDLRHARDHAYTRALLRRTLRTGSSCIDVGAHRGSFLRQYVEFAPHARHWAFEPIPTLAAQLRREFGTAEIHECALSDHDGHATFQYVPELPAWSGLQLQPYPRATSPQPVTVAVRRLDGIIPEDIAVAFMKIDVEGGELEVLRGAEAVLLRCRPTILFECAKVHHAHYATTPQDVHEVLARCGLGVFLMDQSGPLSAAEFAGIYEASHRSGYDRSAWTNFLAMPL
jgi:FkbM family methyltransferase